MPFHGTLDLWHAWPIVGPWRLSRLAGGTNNIVLKGETPSGTGYVLRVYHDPQYMERVHYEGEVLQALNEQGLPFSLPLPLHALDGTSTVSFETEEGTPAFALLYPYLPGGHPDPITPSHAAAAAEAIALMDGALATVPEISTTVAFPACVKFGELAHWLPTVADPLAAVERLPLTPEEISRLRTHLAQIMEEIPALQQQLPLQLVHRDCDVSNTLMDGERVTAIIDFEFVGYDMRVLDLAVALNWWPLQWMGTGQEWPIIDALGYTYMLHNPLTEAELHALPAVIRLRDACSLVHRIGRYLSDEVSDEGIQKRARFSFWREDWLTNNQEQLVHHALQWPNAANPVLDFHFHPPPQE